MEIKEKISEAGFDLLAKIVHGVLEKCDELDSEFNDPYGVYIYGEGVQHAITEIGTVIFELLSSANSETTTEED